MTEDFTGDEVTAMTKRQTDYNALVDEAREYGDALQGREDRNWINLVEHANSLADAVEALVAENENIRVSHERSTDHLAGAAHDALAATMAERDDALRELAESRARFADSEARRVELEAIVREMGEATDIRHGSKLDRLDRIAMLYASAPSTVIREHDKAVAENAIRQHAQTLAETMRAEFQDTIVNLMAQNTQLRALLASVGGALPQHITVGSRPEQELHP